MAEVVTPSRFLDILRSGWAGRVSADEAQRIAEQTWPAIRPSLSRYRTTPHCSSCRAEVLQLAGHQPGRILQFFHALSPGTEFDLSPLLDGAPDRPTAPQPAVRPPNLAGQTRDIADTPEAYAELMEELRRGSAQFRGLSVLHLSAQTLRIYFY